MTDGNKNPLTTTEPYKLRTLLAEGGSYDITTHGGVELHINLELLNMLVQVKDGNRRPNNAELLMFANMILEHKLNPYMKECWLVEMKGRYEPIIAAQAKLRKARACKDYRGFNQGWITKDGNRHPAGRESKALPAEIIGVWGEFIREGQETLYHETFVEEFKRKNAKDWDIWSTKTLTMIQKVNRDHGHKLMYPELLDGLYTENELAHANLPAPKCKTPRRSDRDMEVIDVPTVAGTESGPAGADEATVRTMAEGCLNKFSEKLNAKIHTEILPEKLVVSFCKFCVEVLGGKQSDYTIPETFTLEKIEQLNQAMDEGSILDSIVADLQSQLECVDAVYKCTNKKCREVGNIVKPNENGNCPYCLADTLEWLDGSEESR